MSQADTDRRHQLSKFTSSICGRDKNNLAMPRIISSFFLILLIFVAPAISVRSLTGSEVTSILNEKLSKYDRRIRPNQGGAPVHVTISMYALKLYDYSDMNNDFKIDFYLRQSWKDERLAFQRGQQGQFGNGPLGKILVGHDILSHIWLPDTFFPSDKNGFRPMLTVPNTFVSISSDGTIFQSQRLTTTTDCEGGLGFFPMERHVCRLDIESYGYQTSDIVYKWVSEGTPRVGVAITLPSFDLISITDYESEFGLTTGNFSRIGVKFIIERQLSGYFFRVYLPSIMIVITSFLPFYLSFKLASVRLIVSITVFVLFTLISILISVNFTPKTGEFTTLDLYQFMGFCFTLASLILIVLGIKWNHDYNLSQRQELYQEGESNQHYQNQNLMRNLDKDSNNGRQGNSTRGAAGSCESAIEMNERGVITASAIPSHHHLHHAYRSSSYSDCNLDNLGIQWMNSSRSSKTGVADQIGGIILPLLFLFFNIIYWITSLLFPSALLG